MRRIALWRVFQFDDNARNDERVTSSPPTDELLCRGRDRRTQEGASEGGREANQRNSGGGDGERKAAGGREGAISRSPGTISGKVPRRRHNFGRHRRRAPFLPKGKFNPVEGFIACADWYKSNSIEYCSFERQTYISSDGFPPRVILKLTVFQPKEIFCPHPPKVHPLPPSRSRLSLSVFLSFLPFSCSNERRSDLPFPLRRRRQHRSGEGRRSDWPRTH